jgi:hypothetical protein
MIKLGWRSSRRRKSSIFGDTLGCHHRVNLQMNSKNGMKQVWRYTSTPESSELEDTLGDNMSYGEVSQWNGKEMKEMSRYLLGIVTQSL